MRAANSYMCWLLEASLADTHRLSPQPGFFYGLARCTIGSETFLAKAWLKAYECSPPGSRARLLVFLLPATVCENNRHIMHGETVPAQDTRRVSVELDSEDLYALDSDSVFQAKTLTLSCQGCFQCLVFL